MTCFFTHKVIMFFILKQQLAIRSFDEDQGYVWAQPSSYFQRWSWWRSYLPRPSCFHLINIYGVIDPAAVVVKLDVPSHTLHLDLIDRHTDEGMWNSLRGAYIAVFTSMGLLESTQSANQMMNWIDFNKRCSFMVMRAWIWASSVQRYLEAWSGEQLCTHSPSLCHFPSLSHSLAISASLLPVFSLGGWSPALPHSPSNSPLLF